jgi:hypothetical protein
VVSISIGELPEKLVAGKERIYLSWIYNELAYNKAAMNMLGIILLLVDACRIRILPGSLG